MKKNLTSNELNIIAQFLLKESSRGRPSHGKIKEAADKFGVSRQVVSRIWSRAKQQFASSMKISLSSRKTQRVYPRRQVFDKEKLQSISVQQRGTYRSIAGEMKASKSTVRRWAKEGLIRPHTNVIKPSHTKQNMLHRLKFCLQALEVNHNQNVIKFKSMSHIVHIDEKWYYLSRSTERYYLAKDETEPHRSCQSKKFITRIMFLSVVSQPMYDLNGECKFDGKIGIFPFIEKVPAQRKSKNRAAGTILTKPLDSINKEITKKLLIDPVIPTIKSKWPSDASKDIVIQQDNTPPHIDDNDPDFREIASSEGFNIRIVFQPPNSPDTNVNDLRWFRALQSLQYTTPSSNVDELLAALHKLFDELSHHKLNAVFLTLQICMREIMISNSSNKYKIPYIGKDSLKRSGKLPIDLEVEKELVITCIYLLMEENEEEGLEDFMTTIEGMD